MHVSAASEIDEDGNAIAVGATVEVEGTMGTDGSITASKVELDDDQGDDEDGEGILTGIARALAVG